MSSSSSPSGLEDIDIIALIVYEYGKSSTQEVQDALASLDEPCRLKQSKREHFNLALPADSSLLVDLELRSKHAKTYSRHYRERVPCALDVDVGDGLAGEVQLFYDFVQKHLRSEWADFTELGFTVEDAQRAVRVIREGEGFMLTPFREFTDAALLWIAQLGARPPVCYDVWKGMCDHASEIFAEARNPRSRKRRRDPADENDGEEDEQVDEAGSS